MVTGHGIYDGDGTQTLHYDFLRQAKVIRSCQEAEDWLGLRGTKIPKDRIAIFKKNASKIEMPSTKFRDEDDEDAAIEWQMLAALYLDNRIKMPSIVKKNAILASEYLMLEHASDFRNPSLRRANLRRFIQRVKRS